MIFQYAVHFAWCQFITLALIQKPLPMSRQRLGELIWSVFTFNYLVTFASWCLRNLRRRQSSVSWQKPFSKQDYLPPLLLWVHIIPSTQKKKKKKAGKKQLNHQPGTYQVDAPSLISGWIIILTTSLHPSAFLFALLIQADLQDSFLQIASTLWQR